jgi:tRNA modification GTPase TrmE
MLTKTAAAISTAHGKGGIAVIRISGEDTANIISACFRPKSTAPITPRRATYGEIINANGDVIDDGILTFFKAPHSFTGEDMAEISCHGGILVTKSVLAAVFEAGAEQAEAGEFTKRAFLNGKLTISRAEAIGHVIDAKTDAQLKLASSSARGTLSNEIDKIRDELLAVMAAVMVVMDYPDEDLSDMSRDEIAMSLSSVSAKLSALLGTYKTGKAVTEGVVTVICGKANSGKSSLFNLLAGEDRAIVTEIEGTTRDVLEETVACGAITLRLKDTAGLRETEDVVENIGVTRAREQIRGAELIIAVFDRSRAPDDSDLALTETVKSMKTEAAIAVLNKNDLPSKWTADDIETLKSAFTKTIEMNTAAAPSELIAEVESLYNDEKIPLDLSKDAIITKERQKVSISKTISHLTEALSLLAAEAPLDIATTQIQSALSELQIMEGHQLSTQLTTEIFSKFCVGK